MRAGWLRHRLTIEAPHSTKNTFGEDVVTWVDEATVWASVEPLRGREYLEARQQQAEVTHRVAMRYRDGVEPKKRLRFGQRRLLIESVVNPLERGERLELMCREMVEA